MEAKIGDWSNYALQQLLIDEYPDAKEDQRALFVTTFANATPMVDDILPGITVRDASTAAHPFSNRGRVIHKIRMWPRRLHLIPGSGESAGWGLPPDALRPQLTLRFEQVGQHEQPRQPLRALRQPR